jgi:hypothetical protein
MNMKSGLFYIPFCSFSDFIRNLTLLSGSTRQKTVEFSAWFNVKLPVATSKVFYLNLLHG